MKIEDAKKKWCPMVRFLIGPPDATWMGHAVTNRKELLSASATKCIGPDCAVWVPYEYAPEVQGHCGLVHIKED